MEAADDESEEETIFAISFGFYDIFQYAILDLGDAQNAITQSMHVLFQQLDIIAEHSSSAPQVLISGLWDVTFAPHFQSLSLSENNTLPQFGGAQHKMIYLVEYWNSALIQTSMTWSKGDVFYLNWQNWVMDQIRTTQLHDLNIVDSSGNGKETVVFDDVTSPCLLRSSADNSIACARPERNLFWYAANAVAHLACPLMFSQGSSTFQWTRTQSPWKGGGESGGIELDDKRRGPKSTVESGRDHDQPVDTFDTQPGSRLLNNLYVAQKPNSC